MDQYLSPSASSSKQRPRPLRLASDDSPAGFAATGLLVPASESKREMRLRPSAAATRQLQALDLTPACALTVEAPAQPIVISRAAIAPISSPQLGHNGVPSPPSTPPMRSPSVSFSQEPSTPVSKDLADSLTFDINKGELLGSGVWSNVYRVTAQAPVSAPVIPHDILTPPTTPQKNTHLIRGGASQVYAVKVAARADAKDVFEEEARILSYIQTSPCASTYIIPFHGLTPDSSSLIFTCADSHLQAWSESYSALSELSSLPDLLAHYPSIATQLVSGLSFLHSTHVIHGDIKPANILLSPSGPGGSTTPHARYADFSASAIAALGPDQSPHPADTASLLSVLPDSPASSAPVSRANSQKKPSAAAGGGGTWTFMAPEQLSANPLLNEAGYASDVYGLGVTLLTVLLGGVGPYREVEGQNVFLLREAVKMGDPWQFVKRDAPLRKRLAALEKEEVGRTAVEGLRGVLRKVKGERLSARAWEAVIKGSS